LADKEDVQKLGHYVRETMPNALFACIQAQIGILLLAMFGHTTEVASLGALSRIAILFSIFGSPLFFLAAPAFAKSSTPSHLARITSTVLGSYVGLSLVAMVLVRLYPEPFFWLIGATYSGFERELIWIMVAQALATVDTILWTVALARGWIRRAWLSIPLAVLAQVLVLLFVDPRSIIGVTQLSIAQTLARSLVACTLGGLGLIAWRRRIALAKGQL